ncbi:hypothetical protein ACIBQ6_16780 [Nonomuraea sp. NPDC049655]|uniref:hypothetical protein n=1 Tax=Nonomuraea sp. NPDC049655 TaxID=3364355 RepID=UPI0037A096FE
MTISGPLAPFQWLNMSEGSGGALGVIFSVALQRRRPHLDRPQEHPHHPIYVIADNWSGNQTQRIRSWAS